MKKNLFITIEGPDGAGKSTQIEYIRSYLDRLGLDTLFTREPGGTAISEKLRGIILSKDSSEMSDRAEALLYAASRAQLVSEVIRPALEHGKTVVCDRYIDSSMAYQGYGRDLGDVVFDINEFAVDGIMPDLTILLALDPEKGRARLDQNAMDRLESEEMEFHRKVYDGYIALSEKYPDRIKKIDAAQPIEEVSLEIGRLIGEALGDVNGIG